MPEHEQQQPKALTAPGLSSGTRVRSGEMAEEATHHESLTRRIARAAAGLAEMKTFQARYLARRKARGSETATDLVLRQHQALLAETLDLLEAFKQRGENRPMIGDEQANERWYQANLEAARRCAELREEIAVRQVDLLPASVEEHRRQLQAQKYRSLAAELTNRGEQARRFARQASKAALIEWLLEDHARAVEAMIAEYERQLEESRPDPRWRPRKPLEEVLDAPEE